MTALEQVPVIHPSVTGMERETADHFLLRCSRYSEARSIMKNYVYELELGRFTDRRSVRSAHIKRSENRTRARSDSDSCVAATRRVV